MLRRTVSGWLLVENAFWAENEITWVTRPQFEASEDTVMISRDYDTSAVPVIKENQLTASYPLDTTVEMRVDITEALKAALEKI